MENLSGKTGIPFETLFKRLTKIAAWEPLFTPCKGQNSQPMTIRVFLRPLKFFHQWQNKQKRKLKLL